MSAGPLANWEAAADFALSLPGTVLGSSYGQPAMKIAANGRVFLNVGHEPDTSFVVHLDRDSIEILKEIDPASFWQSAHYEGWPALLVRFDSPDPERVRDVIVRAHEQAAARKPVRPRAR